MLISRSPDLEVCGAAANAADAVEQISSKMPDIAVVDFKLREDSEGEALVETLRRDFAGVKVLVFSMYDDAFHAQEMLRRGVHGYMIKREKAEKVVPVLRAILDGKTYVSPGLSGGAALALSNSG